MKTLLEMLISIKNGQAAGLESVSVPFSNLCWEAAKLLKNEKYVAYVEKKKRQTKKSEFTYLEIGMAYKSNGDSALEELKFFSKPSRHLYVSSNEIKNVKGGFNTLLISTSQGLMTDSEARKNKIGGELIAGMN